MQKKILFFVLLSCFSFRSVAYGALFKDKSDYIQIMPTGEINWSSMSVRAEGFASDSPEYHATAAADFTLEESARNNAQRNLLETVKKAPISTSFHIEDAMEISDDVKKIITALASKAEVIKETKTADNKSAQVILEMKLTGELLDLTLLKDNELPAGPGKVFQGKLRYTSLIFDASKTDIFPVLMPQVIDNNDLIYYSLNKKNRQAAVKNSFVRYFKSLDEAKKSKYAGKMPYIINSYISTSKYKDDTLILPFSILNKIRSDAFYSAILNKCKVIIIAK
jgi:hypothetical protein